jgi:FlaA1/EpsC-like NDP-sugar epimerase
MSGRQRAGVQALADAVAWTLAIVAGLLLRYNLAVPWRASAQALLVCVLLAVAGQAIVGRMTLLYRGRYRHGSFEEVAGVATTVVATTVAILIVDFGLSQISGFRRLPLTVPIAAGEAALLFMVTSRYSWRGYLELHMRSGAQGEPLIVFGAGEGASQVVRSMLLDAESGYLPVALLDDDPLKRNLRMYGVRVLGGRERIAAVAASTAAKNLLIAIPSADAALVRELSALAEDLKLHVKVLPPVSELFDGVGFSDIRDVDLADLLGRRQIDTDIDAIAGYIRGRRVLVTGAGGSIGSELCRQVHRYEPAELMMLDRDESGLHAVQLSIHGRALLDSPELILANIRDPDTIREIFEERRPEVVFHAAALKHLTILERYPLEAVKTNIWGTIHVLRAASAVGVTHFVNISTDKAANAESVLGYTKLITERLTAGFGAQKHEDGRYLSVRFGNVLGSRGSVLTAFRAQVAAGGPITVTDPDVTRYFMTVQEAVQLVVQAGAIGRSGETLVLDMGEPVSIDDVARRLAAESPRHIDVVYTGLRPGEKLHEDLLATEEDDRRPIHPLISHVDGRPIYASDVEKSVPTFGGAHEIHRALRKCAASQDHATIALDPDSSRV